MLDITVDLVLSLFSVLILSKCYFNFIIVIISMFIVSLFCCHVIQCLRHVTISLLLGSMFEIVCVGVCMDGCACVSAF